MEIGNSKYVCPQCTFDNSDGPVQGILVYMTYDELLKVLFDLECEMCGYRFSEGSPNKKFKQDDEEEEEEAEDDDDDNDEEEDYYFNSFSTLQNSNAKRKPIEAVEVAMNENELRSYYDQYIQVLKEQRQQTKVFSDEQLHGFIRQLYQSLQYKHDEPEGLQAV